MITMPKLKTKGRNMEIWFLITCTICISALLKPFFDLHNFFTKATKPKTKLPPGPICLPIVSTLWILHKLSSSQFQPWLRALHARFGPIITLHIGPQPHIFIFGRDLAHLALVNSGALFADRPQPSPVSKILNENQHNISSAGYGSTWRLLRRNLAEKVLHPSRVTAYSQARESAMQLLISRIKAKGDAVNLVEEFQHCMFRLLATMCLGNELDEEKIKEIEDEERRFLLALNRFQVLDFWPWLTKMLLPNRWAELLGRKRHQYEVFMPLIQARKEAMKKVTDKPYINSTYLDSLLGLELQEDNANEKRKLTDAEIVALCSEFLTAGTDTSSTSLQWIMANLVKHSEIQTKLFKEIQAVVGSKSKEVKEEDLEQLPYLRAVILEGLRRHPPGHLLLPHGLTRDAELGGYLVPKNATVHFVVSEMGWDPQIWDHPMEFRPERFLGKEGEGFDMKGGGGEIKMIPFGAGRRICPGYSLGMLHLMYFVANLVWNFEFKPLNGAEINLSEKLEFTTAMKYPLVAQISPRG